MKYSNETYPLKGVQIQLCSFDESLLNERYLSWMSDPLITQNLIKPSSELQIKDLFEYVNSLKESDNNYIFALRTIKDGTHIGNLRIGPIDWKKRDSKFGIMIGDKSFHGKGIATEALKLTLDFVFNYLKLDTFTLEVTDNNAAAIKVYDKIGMHKIGIIEKGFKKENVQRDLLIFQINKSQYQSKKI